jgi:hypothetical protein
MAPIFKPSLALAPRGLRDVVVPAGQTLVADGDNQRWRGVVTLIVPWVLRGRRDRRRLLRSDLIAQCHGGPQMTTCCNLLRPSRDHQGRLPATLPQRQPIQRGAFRHPEVPARVPRPVRHPPLGTAFLPGVHRLEQHRASPFRDRAARPHTTSTMAGSSRFTPSGLTCSPLPTPVPAPIRPQAPRASRATRHGWISRPPTRRPTTQEFPETVTSRS